MGGTTLEPHGVYSVKIAYKRLTEDRTLVIILDSGGRHGYLVTPNSKEFINEG